MRRLKAVRLVQWYHFQDETLPINGSCLLLGDNGSGKTTILDAIQIALVGDLSEVLLNRAANEKSRRTLHGYVRWKIGSEDESRPGELRYGRRACTSYVMLQFSDDEIPDLFFTCGMAFEASETDSDVPKLHFIAPGKSAADIEAVTTLIDGRQIVRQLKDFRPWLRSHDGKYWQDSGTYREELRQRLGTLPESFHRLIVKALAFKPIGQVRQFVFDYLLDPRPIDTAALQANLDHYKHLEEEANAAEQRIERLQEVAHQGERIKAEQRTVETHEYLQLRAKHDHTRLELDDLEVLLASTNTKLVSLSNRKTAIAHELESTERELERIRKMLEGHEVYRQITELERDLADTERRLRECEEADRESRKLLAVQNKALEMMLSEDARELRRLRPALFERGGMFGTQEAIEATARVKSGLVSEGPLSGRDLATWERHLESSADQGREARSVLRKQVEDAKAEGASLQEEQRALEAGRQRYPDGAAALLHLLTARLKGRREPKPLCELIEVPNVRWRSAVEGYLSSRRFDVLVAPEDYPRALALYEKHKHSYSLPGRGNVFIGGVGLVDLERILHIGPRSERHSLAEQVDTGDSYARAYCDFVLGDVVCVDDEQSLRKHRAAITDTVMVYRNHVARQTPREIFSRHYIGEAARHRRLAEIASRLVELHEHVVSIGRHLQWLESGVARLDEARVQLRRLPDLISRSESLQWLKLQARRLEDQKAKIDRKEIEALETNRDLVIASRADLSSQHSDVDEKIGRAKGDIERTGGEIEEGKRVSSAAWKALIQFCDSLDSSSREACERRYEEERQGRSPMQIYEIFERQHRGIETKITNLINHLVVLKTRYIERYGLIASAEGPEYQEFALELEAWSESRLPAYREKIAEAKTKALQQLAEDVVFRLRENLLLVRRQMDELNRALKDVPFGSERYEFTVEIDPEHREFYNLVIDAGRFEKESLFGAAALVAPELKETLSGLLDRLVEAEAREVKTELEAKADYREYFRYDLKIHHADGHYSLYDRISGDKSGGETQTPYYIAILASMYRLYRSRSLDQRPTCGIVLLDEAFGKMDEPRISATLTFARKLGLQLVLATPKERSDMVAPLVERSILIHKDPVTGIPTVLDFTKEFTTDEDVADHGTAQQAAASP